MLAGVYKDYDQDKRILQVVDDVDCLSCEMLSKPGLIRLSNQIGLMELLLIAKDLNCNGLDINTKNQCNYYEVKL